MKGPGLLQMIEIVAGLSIAGPMFVVAVEFLRTGQFAFGAAMLALGTVAMFSPSYLLRRIGGPRAWIRRRLASGNEDEREGDDDRSGPLERFRRE